MQQSYTPLHLYSPILRPCLRKQMPRRRGACGHRVTAFCIVSRWLGHKYTTPGIFSQSPPTQKKLALRGVGSNASQQRQALRALALPKLFAPTAAASLVSCSHRVRRHHSMFSVGQGACHCRSSCSAVALPMASHLLRQSHAFRAGVVFHTFPHSRHYAGHRPVRCDLRSTLTSPVSSFMPRQTFEMHWAEDTARVITAI